MPRTTAWTPLGLINLSERSCPHRRRSHAGARHLTCVFPSVQDWKRKGKVWTQCQCNRNQNCILVILTIRRAKFSLGKKKRKKKKTLLQNLIQHLFFFFFFFWPCSQHVEVPRPGIQHHSSGLSCWGDNAGSLTCCATGNSQHHF